MNIEKRFGAHLIPDFALALERWPLFASLFENAGSILKLSHIKQKNVSKYPKHILLAKVKYMRRG